MELYAVILAAGRGKRMLSLKPKVLHEVLGRPILQYVVDTVNVLNPVKLIVVVGSSAEDVKKRIRDRRIFFVPQKRPLGTGNALSVAKRALQDVRNAAIVVLNGDSPLITAGTLRVLLRKHKRSKNDISFLSFIDGSASGYGRVLRDDRGKVVKIIEEKHAGFKERMVKELNGGVYVMEPHILSYSGRLKKHSPSGEYYLTDIIGMAAEAGRKVNAYKCPAEEIRGVNTREELHHVSDILSRRITAKWMQKGVTFIAPATSVVHPLVSIGRDTILYPNTCLEGSTSIGRNCTIYPGARISDSVLGTGVSVKDCTLIENSRIRGMSTIGPFVHLRHYSNTGRHFRRETPGMRCGKILPP